MSAKLKKRSDQLNKHCSYQESCAMKGTVTYLPFVSGHRSRSRTQAQAQARTQTRTRIQSTSRCRSIEGGWGTGVECQGGDQVRGAEQAGVVVGL